MITRIDGILESVEESTATICVGAIAYEISVPAADVGVLLGQLGQSVTLHTLHYLESQGQGSSFWPRLIGFQSSGDRAFFELVTSVKGIGVRRALRALTIPFPRVAEAIVMKDLALLTSLPEIGRKTAETMVLELRDKVESHARGTARPTARGKPMANTQPQSVAATDVMDAMNVLVQLGESRVDARVLIDKAIEREGPITGTDTLVAAALACKGSPR